MIEPSIPVPTAPVLGCSAGMAPKTDPQLTCCPEFWRLRWCLNAAAPDSPAEVTLQIQIRAHVASCKPCQDWWGWLITQGHVEPHKD